MFCWFSISRDCVGVVKDNDSCLDSLVLKWIDRFLEINWYLFIYELESWIEIL